ncbi:hypothetical protein B0H19DRAFT_1367847 [Mycena capillaripes]|nr:hypothetical protein B0H19DRAFT_1367847 [Mycena capillaripes]
MSCSMPRSAVCFVSMYRAAIQGQNTSAAEMNTNGRTRMLEVPLPTVQTPRMQSPREKRNYTPVSRFIPSYDVLGGPSGLRPPHRRRRGAALFRCRRIPLPRDRPLQAILVFCATPASIFLSVEWLRCVRCQYSLVPHVHAMPGCIPGSTSTLFLRSLAHHLYLPAADNSNSLSFFSLFFSRSAVGAPRIVRDVSQRVGRDDVCHSGRWSTGSLVVCSWMHQQNVWRLARLAVWRPGSGGMGCGGASDGQSFYGTWGAEFS